MSDFSSQLRNWLLVSHQDTNQGRLVYNEVHARIGIGSGPRWLRWFSKCKRFTRSGGDGKSLVCSDDVLRDGAEEAIHALIQDSDSRSYSYNCPGGGTVDFEVDGYSADLLLGQISSSISKSISTSVRLDSPSMGRSTMKVRIAEHAWSTERARLGRRTHLVRLGEW